jgi:hypothetical protein
VLSRTSPIRSSTAVRRSSASPTPLRRPEPWRVLSPRVVGRNSTPVARRHCGGQHLGGGLRRLRVRPCPLGRPRSSCHGRLGRSRLGRVAQHNRPDGCERSAAKPDLVCADGGGGGRSATRRPRVRSRRQRCFDSVFDRVGGNRMRRRRTGTRRSAAGLSPLWSTPKRCLTPPGSCGAPATSRREPPTFGLWTCSGSRRRERASSTPSRLFSRPRGSRWHALCFLRGWS